MNPTDEQLQLISYTKTTKKSHHLPSNPNSSQNLAEHMYNDHLITVLQLLPVDSIIAFSLTCRRFKALASSNSLWEFICRRDWGCGAVDGLISSCPVPQRCHLCWKWLYQQVFQLNLMSCRRILAKGDAFPRPRASHSLNFVEDWLVLFGGGCQGGLHLDDTWIAYVGNGSNNVLSWKNVCSGVPSGRFGQSCTVINDFIVLFGGITDTGARLNDTWIGHIIFQGHVGLKISWRLLELGSTIPSPRGAHAACCTSDRRLVVHGGIGLSGLRLSDTWVLDLSDGLAAGRWYQIVNILPPSPRSGHSLTWIGGTSMVMFGGRSSVHEVLNDVWLLDIGDDDPKWKELKYQLFTVPEEMPLPRVGHSATLILGGKVLVYGGEDAQRHRKDDFWALDINAILRFQSMGLRKASRKLWKKLTVLGHGSNYRSFHGACTDCSGRFVYFFGGMVDDAAHPAEANGLRFDGDLYQVELVLQF